MSYDTLFILVLFRHYFKNFYTLQKKIEKQDREKEREREKEKERDRIRESGHIFIGDNLEYFSNCIIFVAKFHIKNNNYKKIIKNL